MYLVGVFSAVLVLGEVDGSLVRSLGDISYLLSCIQFLLSGVSVYVAECKIPLNLLNHSPPTKVRVGNR